jgi:hypothetical protein
MHMHPYTLRDYIEKGFVNVLMIGKRPWIVADEIDRYNQEGKLSPEPPAEIGGFGSFYGT